MYDFEQTRIEACLRQLDLLSRDVETGIATMIRAIDTSNHHVDSVLAEIERIRKSRNRGRSGRITP